MAEISEILRQVSECSCPLKVSYLAKSNYRYWPKVVISHVAIKRSFDTLIEISKVCYRELFKRTAIGQEETVELPPPTAVQDWKQTHSFQDIWRPPPIAASENNGSGHSPQTPENGKLPIEMRRCFSGDEMSSAHALP